MPHSMRKSRVGKIKPGIPRRAAGILGILALLAIWGAAAYSIDSEIVLPSPLRVLQAMLELFPTRRFLAALAATFLRGIFAFAISMAAGIVVGVVSGLSPTFRSAVAPLLTIIRATPVLAVILLALLWFPSGVVPVFAAVLMAFPIVVGDVLQGILSTDERLLEMARLFRLRRRDLVWSVYAPSITPHLLSAAHGALGLSWKVVVAGEVLSQPLHALGTGMQGARIQLETAEVFAWTAAGIFLCTLTDALFRLTQSPKGKHAV